MMPTAKIKQTSADSAVVEPMALRPGKATRLMFKPQIVNNKQDKGESHSLHGHHVLHRSAVRILLYGRDDLVLHEIVGDLAADDKVSLHFDRKARRSFDILLSDLSV